MTRLPPGRLAMVQRLIAQGLSYAAIGERLGLSKGGVAGTVRRHLHAEWQARPRPEPKPPCVKQPRKPRPPKAAPAPAPPPPPPEYYPDAPGPGACHWPISDGRPWRFCAAAHAPDSVYCAAHHAVAYHRQPPWRAAA